MNGIVLVYRPSRGRIRYGIVNCGTSSQDHGQSVHSTAGESTSGQRKRHHRNCACGPAISRGIPRLCATPSASRQSSFHRYSVQAKSGPLNRIDRKRPGLMELLSAPSPFRKLPKFFWTRPSSMCPRYGQRAGALRPKVLAKRRKARLGDALIAQSCIDHGVALLTRDRDFLAFAEAANLRLALGRTPRKQR